MLFLEMRIAKQIMLCMIAFTTISANGAEVSAPKAAAAKNGGSECSVAQFKSLALNTHNPSLRNEKILALLQTFSTNCSLEKMLLIRANRSLWLGTADSHEITEAIDMVIESKVKDPNVLKELYGAKSKDSTPEDIKASVNAKAVATVSPSPAAVQGYGAFPNPANPQGNPGQPQQGYPGQPQQGYPGQPQQGYPGQPQQGYPVQPQQGYPGQPQQGYPGQQPPVYR